MKKIYLFSNTCTQRALDQERLKHYFVANGFKIAGGPKEADIILFVTCAFDKTREDLSIKNIMHFKKYKGELIVAGCLSEINRSEMLNIHKGRYISTKELDQIDNLFPECKVSFNKIPDANIITFPITFERIITHISLSANFFRNTLQHLKNRMHGFDITKSKAFLRINRGCLGNCSYCVARKAIGILKSKPTSEIISEWEEITKKGCREVIITSDDAGAYGLDIGDTLPSLLEKIISSNKDILINLEAINPRWIIKYKKEFLNLVKYKKISFICCPIQSANRRILKLMNRDIDVEELAMILIEFKKINPELKIATNIIAGFPSETPEEFQDTLNFIKKVRFDNVLFFHCYVMAGTAAEDINPKIDNEEIKRRINLGIDQLRKEKILAFKLLNI